MLQCAVGTVSSSINTVISYVVRDSNVADVVRCFEVDRQPRVVVTVRARQCVWITVNSQRRHVTLPRTGLKSRLVQRQIDVSVI